MKHWLQSRSVREQMLVTVLVVAFALVWLLSAFDRLSARVTDWKTVSKQLAGQQLWLEQRAQIDSKAGEAIKNLDPARTQDRAKLVATVTTLATQAGLQPVIDVPQTTNALQFNYHMVRVSFRGATLGAMLSFYDELTKQVPYLNLELVTMQTDRSKIGQLSVTVQISATQIASPARS